MSTSSMYRVGDYVYFESSSTNPYHIRRIEELNKTPSGYVEAKVMCFFRRRDLPNTLITLADKHQNALEAEGENVDRCDLTVKERHQLKHRELFLSRQVETLPATHIRGKCSVTLLNETESLGSYLNKDDTFFYCLVYDPSARTLLADKGEIRVGSKYQADTPALLKEDEPDPRKESMETLVWTPEHDLTDRQIDQFLVTSRSIGTFARALDCSSSVKQPSLHMSAAAASRDITLFHAMDTLHKHRYDLSEAESSLVPSTGPVLCKDEMEEWSASEANLFEEALEKYGKDFKDIRQDFLPWKSIKNIIEYYYMWKTTDRYVQKKRVKAVEAESKLKLVHIPNYTKQNPAAITSNKNGTANGAIDIVSNKPCESCGVSAAQQWFSWGPSNMQSKLCQVCWSYWKKFGGLKNPATRLDGSLLYERIPSQKCDYEKVSNIPLSSSSLKRKPFDELNGIEGIPPTKRLLTIANHFAGMGGRETTMSPIAPPRRQVTAGGSTLANIGNISSTSAGPIGSRSVITHHNGKVKYATTSRTGRKQVISLLDARDDLNFKSNKFAKKARRQVPAVQLKRAARKPWRKLPAVWMMN